MFLGDLEDFLIQKFQHGDHYQMLKAVSTPLNDMYKAGAGIDKEVGAIKQFPLMSSSMLAVSPLMRGGGGGGGGVIDGITDSAI